MFQAFHDIARCERFSHSKLKTDALQFYSMCDRMIITQAQEFCGMGHPLQTAEFLQHGSSQAAEFLRYAF